MTDVLKHHFQLILPTLATLLSSLLVLAMLMSDLGLAPAIPLFFNSEQALLNLQLLEGEEQAPQVVEAGLACLYSLAYDVVGVLLLGEVLDFREEDLVHAGVRVGVCKFEEVVAVEIWHLLAQPLVLHAVQVPVQNQLLPSSPRTYLLSSAWIF